MDGAPDYLLWSNLCSTLTKPFGIEVEGLPVPVHVAVWEAAFGAAMDALRDRIGTAFVAVDAEVERRGDAVAIVVTSEGGGEERAELRLSRFLPDPYPALVLEVLGRE